ncbi:MAG: LLM class flavin-dependent oxidoreductase, partial [Deltaproteobacteria bacterium]|nr:LLM class flavin-dependent oxidoreductase [Deltaproteobacteria bacterium]
MISVERDGTIEVATGQGTLRFSKVLCREGTPLSQNELFALGIRPGVRLPSPSALAKKALSDLDRQLAKHEIFWSKRLPELLPLELGLERSPGSSPKPIRIPLRLSTSLTPSDFVALACAWAARVTGQLRFDIAYRFPRLASLFRQAPHLLSEFAPLRVELDESLSFSDFRQKIEKERAQIEERAPYRRDLYPRIPHAIRPRWEFGVAIVDEELPSPSSPIPLLFTFLSSSNEAFICFDSSLFSLTSIEEHAERFLVLVDAALKAQGTPVIHLPILSEGEKKKLLDNQSLKPISPRCIHEIIEASVDQHPQKTAVVFENQTITYRELDEASNQLAHFISQRSLEPDDRVAIFLPRSIEMVIGVLATWKAGAAYLPVDPSYPEERIVFYLEDSEAKLILTIEALLERLRPEWREKAICLDRERSAIMEMPKGRPSPKAKPSHLAYLIYTSGSTGTPKGVMVEHRQVANFFEGIDAVIPHDPPGTWLAVTSLSFDISVLELFYTLARGFTVVIAGELEKSFTSHSPIRHRRIGFSLFYFASDDDEKRGAEKYRLLFEGARFADKRGFEAIWTPERHFGAFGGLYPNPSVISAAIAAITERIHIRAGSCVLPLHHPIRVVEEWALVDNISGGRVGISFASGWHPIDFVLRPENHANAKQIMLRDIETVRRLWRGEGVEFEGPTGKVSIRTRPRPVQKELPIWITAAGNPETFVAAAKAKAGVLTHLLGQSFEEVKEKIALYRRTWKECGHEGEGHVTLMLHTFVGEDDEKVREIVREPMKNYLRSSINLIAEHAWSFPAFKRHAKEGVRFEDNFASLSPEDAEALLDHAFERYYETAGLFGSQKRALEIVERCKAIGVDEIACLIDFGVDTDTVLKHLEFLDALRKRAEPRPNLDENDYSIPAQIERWGVTHLQCTPSMARMLLEDEATRLALGRISHLFIGGEALPGALVSRLKEVTSATITNMYGPTETTIWSSTAPAKAVEG